MKAKCLVMLEVPLTLQGQVFSERLSPTHYYGLLLMKQQQSMGTVLSNLIRTGLDMKLNDSVWPYICL